MHLVRRACSLLVSLVAVTVLITPSWNSSTPNGALQFSELTSTTITTGGGGGGVVVTITGGSTGGTSGGGGSASPTTVTIYVPYITIHAGNSLAQACVGYRTVVMANSYAAQLELNNARALWARYATLYQRCTPPVASAPPPPSPSAVASSQWQQRFVHLLPVPTFTIPPGFGVINIPSYLVTHGQQTVNFSDSTALGSLSITATSTYFVSSDGGATFRGPFPKGDPWPTGGITLQWRRSGNTTITVKQNWLAHWSLDGQSGSFPTVITTASKDFHVISLTALHFQTQS